MSTGRTRTAHVRCMEQRYWDTHEVMELLLESGADPAAQTKFGTTPRESTRVNWQTTRFIAELLGVPSGTEADIRAGRACCRALLKRHAGELDNTGEDEAGESALDALRQRYAALVSSDRLAIRFSEGSRPFHLVLTPVFAHLWFLWFLCWLVAIFAGLASVAGRFGKPAIPRWVMTLPVRLLWLLPLSMLPQLLMGSVSPGTFGPDTSDGILPQPHLLVYYGIFFGVGAIYFDCDDHDDLLGRWWWLSIPLSLLVLLPLGMVTMGQPALSGLPQICYAWGMTFGLIGLFRKALSRESGRIRYLSDSAYWLYLMHLPLVMLVQALCATGNCHRS